MTSLLLLLVLAHVATAKTVHDQVDGKKNWVWLDRFCYDDQRMGTLEATVWFGERSQLTMNGQQRLLAYYGKAWDDVYKNDKMSCAEKSELAFANYQVDNGVNIVRNTDGGQRPRFYYYVLADCTTDALKADVDLRFLNGGDGFDEQFSFDERGMFELYTSFLIFFAILTMVQSHSTVTMSKGVESLHPLVKLLSTALVCQAIAVTSQFVHYGAYSQDGVGSPGLSALGNIMDMSSQLFFMLLVILIARGWTISSSTIQDQQKVFTILAILAILYLSLFIYEYAAWDPASEQSIYESDPAIVLLVLRLCIMFWFIFCVRQTYIHEPRTETQRFYTIFGISMTAWFLSYPIIVALAATIDPWYRVIVVTAVNLVVSWITFAGMTYLLWPSRVSQYFQLNQAGDVMPGGIAAYDEL